MGGTGAYNFVTFAPMNIYKVKINFEEKGHETIELPIAEGESVLDVCLENGIELQDKLRRCLRMQYLPYLRK